MQTRYQTALHGRRWNFMCKHQYVCVCKQERKQKVISENQREPATHTNKTNIKRALKGGVHICCPIRKRPKSRCASWCNHTERHRQESLTSASEEVSTDSDAGGRRDQGMSPRVTGRPRDIQVFRHSNNPSCTHSTDSPRLQTTLWNVSRFTLFTVLINNEEFYYAWFNNAYYYKEEMLVFVILKIMKI